MEQLTTLPPVAKNVYQPCKKCGSEKSHLVLAHKSPTSASIECTTCKSKKTLRLTVDKPKSTTTRAPRAPKNTAAQQWEALDQKYGSENAPLYAPNASFKANSAINHSTFGIGYITSATNNRIEVVFIDSIRVLVQNS